MEKRYGSPKRQDGLYRVGRNKYDLFYGFGKDREEDTVGWNHHHRFGHRPSEAEIRETVLSQINADTDALILSGHEWRGTPVWLSSENQFNYKAAYDIAVQTGGATLPVTFKLGTDSAPVYHTFGSLDELHDFYTSCLMHIQDALAAGWREKEGVDWSAFANEQ